LVLCLSGVAVGNAADVPSAQTNFDRQNVSLEGTVASLKETTSRRGNDYSTFKLEGSPVSRRILAHSLAWKLRSLPTGGN
jgi:hypothetical protein